MGRRTVACIGFGAFLTCGGWLLAQAPAKPTPDDVPKTKPPVDAKPTSELDQFLKQHGYTAIPLERCRAGYTVVVVSIGAKKLRLLVDTGAIFSCLDVVRTKELKLDWKDTNRDAVAKGFPEWNAGKSCNLAVTELGEFKAEGKTFCTYDVTALNDAIKPFQDQPIDGILASDFLKEYSGIVDVRGLRLYLRSRP